MRGDIIWTFECVKAIHADEETCRILWPPRSSLARVQDGFARRANRAHRGTNSSFIHSPFKENCLARTTRVYGSDAGTVGRKSVEVP